MICLQPKSIVLKPQCATERTRLGVISKKTGLVTPRLVTVIGKILGGSGLEEMETPTNELRDKLMYLALRRGVKREDSEDLSQEAWLKTYAWSQLSPRSREEIERYAFATLKNMLVDHWSSPQRVIAKRISRLISSGILAEWTLNGVAIIGSPSQRHMNPLEPVAEARLSDGIRDFLYSEKGLRGEPPSNFSTRRACERYLVWAGGPVSRSHLLAQLAGLLVVPRFEVSFSDDFDVEVVPQTSMGFFGAFWEAVTKMPFRMRAAVLLMCDAEQLGLGSEIPAERLKETLPEWPEPPPLAAEDLSLDDQFVAEKLGVTKGNLQVIRNRALSLLARTLGSFEPDFRGVEA